MKLVRKAIALRYHLLPYLYDLAHEDLPMLRPLILEYPTDKNCENICDQFLIGDKLMAAPIMAPGTFARSVYLPKGVWYDYYTGKRYTGGKYILAEAPMDHLPLFAKAGAIIPVSVGTPECVEDIVDVKLEVFPGNGTFPLHRRRRDDGLRAGPAARAEDHRPRPRGQADRHPQWLRSPQRAGCGIQGLIHITTPQASPQRGTPGWPLLPFGQFTFRWPGKAGSEGWELMFLNMPEITNIP